MKKIIFVLALFVSFVANAQKTTGSNYTFINQRYEWLTGIFQAFNLPSGDSARHKSGQDMRSGAVYLDTVNTQASPAGFYIYKSGVWELQDDNNICQNRFIDPITVTYTGVGMKFFVSGGRYQIGCNFYSLDSATLTLSDGGADPRKDVFYLDATGAHVLEGEEGVSPIKPQVDGDQLELTFVDVAASATTPGISTVVIYDENIEYVITNTGTTTDPDNTTNVYKGAKSLNVTNISNNDIVTATGGATINVREYDAIAGFIKLKTVMSGAGSLRIRFFTGATAVSNEVIIPINKNSTNWQGFSVPISNFNFSSSSADKINIRYVINTAVVHAGFYLDFFGYQFGLSQPSQGATITMGALDGAVKSPDGGVIANDKLHLQTADATYPGLMPSILYSKLTGLRYNYFIKNLTNTYDTLATAVDDSTVGIKALKAGTNVTLDVTDTTITVNSSGGVGSGTVNSGAQYRLGYYATTGTAISEAPAITANRALISDANGVPTQSATTATELGYVSGVTSAIQTQINDKVTKTKVGPDFVVTNDSLFLQNAINVKKYGATGDGVTNDQPAITAAIAAMSATQTLYFPAGNYKVNSTVTVNKTITIVGEPFARINISGNFSAFTLGANNIKIHKLSFLGSGKGGANTSQIGINCNSFYYFDIAGCEFYNLNGIGLYWLNTTVGSTRYGGRVSNCYFNSNNVGFQSGASGEYVTITGGTAQGNNIGGVIIGGNVNVANMSIVDNGVGLEWRTGTNNGHGSVTGCLINHNTTYNIKLADVALGVVFSACQIFDSNIWLKNTDGVVFDGCELAPISWFFENSKNTTISSSTLYTGYGFTVNNNYNSTTSSTYWTANTKLAGTQGWIEGTDITTTAGKVGDIIRYLEGSTASSATPTPTGNARDNAYDVTALATNPTFAAPSGTAANHNRIYLRIKDDGTARTLTWNAIYRGSLPTTTVVGETLNLNFIYNSADTKWDLISFTKTDARGAISLTTNGTSGASTYNSATGVLNVPVYAKPTLTHNATIENPTASENMGWFKTPVAITITNTHAVLVGSSTPSVTYQISFGTDITSLTNVYTAGQTVTSTTTGTAASGVNDATIPANSWIRITTSAQSGTVGQISLSITYTED